MERFYDVTIYEVGCEDFDNEGICGPLFPTECYHDEEGNGGSEITLEHPFDDQGKWREITAGRILKCWVQNHIPPEISENKIVTSVEKWTVKNTATSAQRAMYNKQSGGRKLKTLPAGLSVTVVQKPDSGRYKIKSSSHGTGFVDAAAMEYETSMVIEGNVSGIESAEPGGCITWQLFEITRVNKKNDSGIVANAHIISYQMLSNNTTWNTTESATIGEALNGIMGNCLDEHEFCAYTDMADARTGFGWRHLNPVKCMLDPENGVVALFPCELVRDNWELYFLSQAGRNRGVRIEPGKNMEGVEYDEDMNGLYTHIMPIGHTKSGEELYLPEVFVVSPLAEAYHRKFIYPLECTDCDVGKNGITEEIALNRMRKQAQAVLDGGCDVITRSVRITMAALTGEAGGRIAAALEPVLLYDYVTALHPDFGINLIMKIVRRRWDCLRGRLISVEMGTVAATLSMGSLASWQIPNGVSGSKIIAGSIGSSALQDGAIATRHIQSESINTQALQAEAVTAEKVAAGAIKTKHLAADAITADLVRAGALEVITARIESLSASDIITDRLAAALAAFTVLAAGTAEFDRATVQHLVAEALNLSFGVGDEVFIKNLKVVYAQMVSAAIGNLVIKASDGKYYEIDVDEDGKVSATPSTVTDGEISAGQTDAGKVIIGTDITAESLNTSNLLATYALVNKIDAARIDVDQLWARQAFIDHLNTADISSNGTITIIAGKVDDAQSTAKTANNNANTALSSINTAVASVDVEYYLSESATELIGGVWDSVAPEWVDGKYMWSRTVTALKNGTVNTSDPTCIAGAAGKGITGFVEQYYISDSKSYPSGGEWITEMPDISDDDKYIWTRSLVIYTDGEEKPTDPVLNTALEFARSAKETADAASNNANDALDKANAAMMQDDFERVVRIDDSGLHVGDNKTNCEMLIDSASINMVVEGKKLSTLSGNFIRFGKMQIRKGANDLVICAYKG